MLATDPSLPSRPCLFHWCDAVVQVPIPIARGLLGLLVHMHRDEGNIHTITIMDLALIKWTVDQKNG